MDIATRAYVAGVDLEADKMKKDAFSDILSNIGMLLLVLGFVLQFIANYVEGAMMFDISFRPNF
ncbi:MAG: hypothetical protein GF409_00300 [Candidatus Omnitrophica bacterium]|nr:hypothetical protein [Candidatus Omnitrophota bacterium]